MKNLSKIKSLFKYFIPKSEKDIADLKSLFIKLLTLVISLLLVGIIFFLVVVSNNIVKEDPKIEKAKYEKTNLKLQKLTRVIEVRRLNQKSKKLGITNYHSINKNVTDYGITRLSRGTVLRSKKGTFKIYNDVDVPVIFTKNDKKFYVYKNQVMEKAK